MPSPVTVASAAATGNDDDCANSTFEISRDCDGSPPAVDLPSYHDNRADLTPRRVEGDRATIENVLPVSSGQSDNSWRVVIENADAETPACDPRAARPQTEDDLRGDGARRPRDRKCCPRCCRRCLWVLASVKFIFGIIGAIGILCLAFGISLGSTDNEMTEDSMGSSFAFIGAGAALVTMILLAWRCYPNGIEPIHAMFGIESFGDDDLDSCHLDRRRWYAGVGLLYPEFQYITPPPSYTVAMLNYILSSSRRSAARDDDLEQRGASTSPPPSYRSNATTLRSPPNAGRGPSFRSPGGATIAASEAPSYLDCPEAYLAVVVPQ